MVFLAAFAAVSCLNSGSYSQSYTADITFEFSEAAYTTSFKDSIYVMTEGNAFLYMQHPFFFAQKYSNGVVKGGFSMSILKGEKDGALTREPMANDAFRVNAEAGHNGSKTYAVFYASPVASDMPEHDIEFGYKNNGYMTPNGFYVNNTTLVARKSRSISRMATILCSRPLVRSLTVPRPRRPSSLQSLPRQRIL